MGGCNLPQTEESRQLVPFVNTGRSLPDDTDG
jgi:hypothetical protein